MSTVEVAPCAVVPAREQDPGPLQLDWRPAHRREDVERYLDDVAQERRRLEEAIEAARARTERARQRSAARLREEATISLFLLDAQRELAAIERAHVETLEALSEDAERRAARVIEEARADAEAIRAAAASLAELLPHDGD